MGRVFSYPEVLGGAVPSQSDFKVAAEIFDTNCMLAVEQGALIGSVVFGSAAIDRATPRSDFDCLLIVDGSLASYRTARKIVENCSQAVSGRVEFSPIPYSRDTLAKGLHEIDRYFGHHLTGPDRVVRGEDVATFITYDQSNGLDIFNNYARNKKRRLATTMVATEEVDTLKGLTRLLELPLAIGRKLVKIVEEENETDSPGLIHTADKQLVGSSSIALFEELGLHTFPRSLLDADAAYSILLGKTQAGDVTAHEYETNLEDLRSMVPDALHWLTALDQILPEYFEAKG